VALLETTRQVTAPEHETVADKKSSYEATEKAPRGRQPVRMLAGVASSTRVYLEVGKRWGFARALDWPGLARRENGEQTAMEQLDLHEARYPKVAGSSFRRGPFEIAGHLKGGAHARKLGLRPAPRTPWPQQRAAIVDALANGELETDEGWPASHGVGRIAWHVLDHAWEIEDRS
jgi:hypothetical protein